jgi:predicted nucleic-acid-binding protein
VKGIDTNVLVRYLVQDHPEQARRAVEFITSECSVDTPALIDRIVLCELVWVLESAYGYSRDKVSLALEGILRTKQFTIENHQEAWCSFREYQDGADFADSFIGSVDRRLGCKHTVTFDRKAGRLIGFALL